ncbi:MAG: acyltransferase [Clostridia bacterium]|nr:acyltransferase [Clostridia bacterium]
MIKQKEYYKRLDYLRIISCIAVLLYHLNILKGGFLAVCTFFALSGYLSCISALKKEKFSIKDYYFNRLKKIFFPLIIVVFVTIIIYKINPFTNWINLKPETNSVIFGYNNFWQLNANLDYFTRNVNSPFTHFWYISILMQFELIFPILFVIFKNINKKIKKDISTITVSLLTLVSTIVFFVMSLTQDIMIVYYNTFARCFSLLFGILLALLHYKYNFKISRPFKKLNKLIYLIYNIVLIALCVFVTAESNNYAIFMILATIISIRIIEYSVEKSGKREKTNKLVELFAKDSYGIYLVQYPVIYFLQGISTDAIKIPLVIIITLITAHILSLLTNNKAWKEKIICLIIIILGGFLLITQKDYSDEMKELENLLNENQKTSEQQNNEFLNSTNEDQKEEQAEEKVEEKKEQETSTTVENIEEKKNKVAETVRQLPIVGVGDSVLLGVSDEMRKQFPNGYFDGKVSRTIVGGKEVMQNLKAQGKLTNTLVLALANNGDYIEKRNKDLMEFLGDREIYWVNAVGADDPKFNEKFKEFAANYPNLHIVDWVEASKGHPEYFYADGIHLKGDGIKAYVDTIYNAIYNQYLQK